MMRPAFLLVALAACSSSPEGVQNPKRDAYYQWEKVEPPGMVCSNGSQFKFWVNFSDQSDNLVVVFEPGGACWDYPSCSGAAGIRGAANPDGLMDDHWAIASAISPFLSQNEDSPSTTWNMVWVPYCTGDVHTGNVDKTYTDEVTGATLDFHHQGHADVQSVVSWLDGNFTHVPKMLVTGCSAGGVGALVNYQYLRNGIHSVKQSYLLDDSGPIFPSNGYSGPLHQKIRSAWNLDSLAGDMPAGFTFQDMGSINTALADEFPNDRLATTFFERDKIYSGYSYDRFYDPQPTVAQEMDMWAADTNALVSLYSTRPNLHYYLPYWRALNDSHCTTAVTFTGSEIHDGSGMTLAKWVNDFVNDKPIDNIQEAPVPGEDP